MQYFLAAAWLNIVAAGRRLLSAGKKRNRRHSFRDSERNDIAKSWPRRWTRPGTSLEAQKTGQIDRRHDLRKETSKHNMLLEETITSQPETQDDPIPRYVRT